MSEPDVMKIMLRYRKEHEKSTRIPEGRKLSFGERVNYGYGFEDGFGARAGFEVGAKAERRKVLSEVEEVLKRYIDPSDLGGCYGDPHQVDEIFQEIQKMK